MINDPNSFANLVNDPEFFFHSFRWKFGSARFVKLVAAEHRFHSAHAARARAPACDISINELLEICTTDICPLKPLRYIFMTDFCGSTLLARALGELAGLFCYNEPRAFVSLSRQKRRINFDSTGDPQQWKAALKVAAGLMGRTFEPNSIALIKDQPLTNYIIPELLDVTEDTAGVFLYSTLSDYLKAVYREERRRAYARERVTQSFRETITIPALASIDKMSLSDARAAAMHWLIQMYLYLNAFESRNKNKLCSLRSDQFHAQPAQCIKATAGFFNIDASAEVCKTLVESDIFRQHSKNPRETYNPEAESEQNAFLSTKYSDEINDALDWANMITKQWPIPDFLPGQLDFL